MSIDIAIKYITNQDGETFFTQRWIPEAPKALIILVHGFGDYSGRYSHVVNYFAREGFAIATYDQRGHGRSDGRRGDIDSFEQLVQDLNSFVWETRHEVLPGTPVFIVAMSVGALIAVNYAVQHPKEIDGLILVSPAFELRVRTPAWMRRFGEKLVKFLPRLKVKTPFDAHDLTRDEDVVNAYYQDPFVFQYFTLRTCQILLDATALVMPLAFRLRQPILLIQPKGDPLCSSEATHRFFMQLADARKKLRLIDGNFHEPFNDPVRGEIMEEVAQWIEAQVRKHPPPVQQAAGRYEQRRLL